MLNRQIPLLNYLNAICFEIECKHDVFHALFLTSLLDVLREMYFDEMTPSLLQLFPNRKLSKGELSFEFLLSSLDALRVLYPALYYCWADTIVTPLR